MDEQQTEGLFDLALLQIVEEQGQRFVAAGEREQNFQRFLTEVEDVPAPTGD